MSTQEQRRQISADMAVRLVHWLMDMPTHPKVFINALKRQMRESKAQEREQKIADAYANGMRLTDMKAIFNCAETTILRAVDAYKVPRRRRSWRFN